MVETTKNIRKALLKRANDLQSSNSSFANFLYHTTSNIDEQDLAGFSAQNFEAVLKHSLTRLKQRQQGEHLINIWTPDADNADKVQIIDIFIDDMPFLVDSVLSAIRAMGGTIQLLAHA